MSFTMNIGRVAEVLVLLGVGLASVPSWAAPPLRLTTDGRVKQDPAIVRSGREVLYAVEHPFNQLTLMRLKLPETLGAGGTNKLPSPEPLHPGATTSEFGVTHSADDRVVAYVRNDGNLHVRIVIEEPTADRKVDFDPGGGFAGIATLSLAPNGQRLAYAFPEQAASQHVHSLGVDGQNKRPLTTDDAFHTWPRYSPDGRQIALASTRSGNFDIGVMDATGGPVRLLTTHPGLDTHPAWSPDGKRLAYTSLRDGNYDVFVMNSDGSRSVRVTEHAERDDYPVWHPDGRHLILVSERDGRHDLYWLEAPAP